MLNTEEYFGVNDVSSKTGETMFHLTNGGMLPDTTNIGQHLSDKVGGNVTLLNELGEYKPINGGVTNGGPASNIDEQRALQLALELSMLGLTNDEEIHYNEMRMKKSMNMTECVPVPSSEHVAEIVGRQGTNTFVCFAFFIIYLF